MTKRVIDDKYLDDDDDELGVLNDLFRNSFISTGIPDDELAIT